MFGQRALRFAIGAGLAMTFALTGAGGSIALADHGDDHHDDHSTTGSTPSFGAWLYEGTCDALASSPLEDIGDLEADDSHDAERELALTPPAPSTIWSEDEDIHGTYASLTDSPHAIVVRASEAASSDVIACGEITHAAQGNDPFSIELRTVNDSGYTGQARFSVEQDDHQDEVKIVVGVWEGTSSATPASGTPAA